MITAPSYGKILTLGSTFTENALIGEVIVQEKVDGSLFCFGLNEKDELVMRSKGAILTEDNYAEMFGEAVKYAMGLKEILPKHALPDTYFYCEYLQKPKHNTLKYTRTPQNHLVLFDIVSEGKYVVRNNLEEYAQLLEIDVVPELYRGEMTKDKIQEFLTTTSYLGEEIIEGIVMKNYHQTILLGGNLFPLFTKYVREEFRERHTTDWKIRSPKTSLQDWVNGFESEARWQKAFLHLKEKGLIENQPKDIGLLIPEVKKDIVEEEAENIRSYLYKCFIDDILRKATGKLPMWYKNKLLENVN